MIERLHRRSPIERNQEILTLESLLAGGGDSQETTRLPIRAGERYLLVQSLVRQSLLVDRSVCLPVLLELVQERGRVRVTAGSGDYVGDFAIGD